MSIQPIPKIDSSGEHKVYRILSIDGGGIKGVFPAAFLASIEESQNDNIANYFDLIVGTSTGGIIALGLGMGLSAREILSFYERLGHIVFSGNNVKRFIKQYLQAKYDSEPLRMVLTETFGTRKLGHSNKRLVIPSLNLETGKVHVYKTAHHPRLEMDYKIDAVSVALATAAAPTYFPTHRMEQGMPLVDGGVWANNPVGIAVVEAIGVLGWPRDGLKVLSLGCTSEPFKVNQARRRSSGSLYWATKIVDLFFAAQSHSSLGISQLLAGHDNVFRYSPVMPNGRFQLDGISEIDALKGLGYSEAREAIPVIRRNFLTKHTEEFLPFHQLNE